MSSQEIGRIVAVDAAQVTVELSKEFKALATSTYEGISEVGRINSYIIIPTGAHRVVGMVTRVVMSEESQLRADKMILSLPTARRHLYATLVGTIDGRSFEQGVSIFPVLDTPVEMTTKGDLEAIFGKPGQEVPADAGKPGFCIPIGKSAVFDQYDVKMNPDIFLGKHLAVLGSTGSGKSCSVSTIIQSILETDKVRNCSFVIFDTNGEYRSAFSPLEAAEDQRALYLPSDPLQPSQRLVIPYWFMNSEDFCRLFRASEGTQRPVLIEALSRARSGASSASQSKWFIDSLQASLNNLLRALEDDKRSLDVQVMAKGIDDFVESEPSLATKVLGALRDELGLLMNEIAKQSSPYVGEYSGKASYNKSLPASVTVPAQVSVHSVLAKLFDLAASKANLGSSTTADSPSFFSKTLFVGEHIGQALRMQPGAEGRTREYCATMLMRITRFLTDKRFDFLFGSPDQEWPACRHSLAAFLRDILGLPSGGEGLSAIEEAGESVLPFYDRQRAGVATRRNVVIVDLSLLASEVLENIVALLGRLILEFLQRASDESVSGTGRGKLPVVLVLEEAQNYIRDSVGFEDKSVAREVFERIAREGRKYGLGLVVASQRPSELSKTVLSQCNSFVVHRLQNPEDLRYFREIVPAIFEPLLRQLPSLPQRYALVLGEGVRAPTLAYMREASPMPDSQDPKLYEHWVAENPKLPDVEAVCEKWEGALQNASDPKTQGEPEAAKAGPDDPPKEANLEEVPF
jgi:hypothetical protein